MFGAEDGAAGFARFFSDGLRALEMLISISSASLLLALGAAQEDTST